MILSALRRRFALAICPELGRTREVPTAGMNGPDIGCLAGGARAEWSPRRLEMVARGDQLRRLAHAYAAAGHSIGIKSLRHGVDPRTQRPSRQASDVYMAVARCVRDPNSGVKMETLSQCARVFSAIWPEDLPWPADIPRPAVQPRAEESAA